MSINLVSTKMNLVMQLSGESKIVLIIIFMVPDLCCIES